jgi:cbb3-type cytochrome oxidase maturation protein
MDIYIYLLIPTFILATFVFALFWWSLKHKQYEDLEGQALRVLHIDERKQDSGDQ